MVIFSVGIDDRNFTSVHDPDGIHAILAVVEAVVEPFDGWPFEDSNGVFECDSMKVEVAAVLFLISTVAHFLYLHNVNTDRTFEIQILRS